ncbi:hypothetical protein ACVXZ4_08410 [Lacisediminihabitans sp. FW035]
MPTFAKTVAVTFLTIISIGSFCGLAGPSIVAADSTGLRVFPSIERSVLAAVPALGAEKKQLDSAAAAYKEAAASASKIDRSDAVAAAAEDRPIRGSEVVDLANCGGATTIQLSAMLVEAGGEALVCSKG